VVSSLSCHFIDNHGVMGFILSWSLDCQRILDLGEVVLGKSKEFGVEMVFSGIPLTSGWRKENASG